uniref:Ig-like domain-containing protein n=1 Tax=Cyprinus carpio carpio TaxID=630221 RepID=A0A9J8CQX3_CYPCA
MSHKLRNIFLFTLFIFLECRSEDTVDQPDKHVSEVEGRSVELKCKYKTVSVQEELFWYIQKANDFPKYILRRNKYGGENDVQFQERFHSEVSSNSVPLTIKNLRVSDSAVYYCALRPTVRKPTSNHIQKNT